ncbi:MAG: response regulator [Magnetococcales bacterium]|nr:response regulator [Magnetococcales bacterium]MBF0174116.1 response regulator [Magnetococcales bacterium]MBF0631999.1 response regulator [Magnetococcales bacterium]
MHVTVELSEAHILIVDDQPANNRLMRMILERAGFKNITTTHDSRESVRLYLEGAFDLVLLDYNMPHMNGIEVMESIRAARGEVHYLPVLMITAVTDREVRHAALNAGALDFLNKPLDHMEVIPRVCNLLTVHLLKKGFEDQVRVRTLQLREANEQLELANNKLQRAKLEVLQCLGRASEFRDNETGNHVLRMSRYAGVICRVLCQDESFCECVESAAAMHDVGKIGIPDSILLKSGRLTDEEFDQIRKHPAIGAEILGGVHEEPLLTAHTIALTHHERWDGKGYPKGLKGEEIPLVGRICAVVDVFDALVSQRPYKKAWSVEEAVTLLQRDKGSHFDPGVVDAFVSHLEEILKIREELKD